MQQLSEHGLIPEQWGGDTIMVEVSALQNLGIDDLLEQLLLVADLEDLHGQPRGPGQGRRARGQPRHRAAAPSPPCWSTEGTLKVGDPIVAGAAWGTVRALIDDKGNQVKEAGPSTPVQVLGLSDGARRRRRLRGRARRASSRQDRGRGPRALAARRQQRRRRPRERRRSSSKTSSSQIQAGETATLNLILKADVHGFARGAHREPAQARARRGEAVVRAPRRRRHHRERHPARRRVERHDHRLQRPPRPQGARAGRARRRRDPHLRDHLPGARGHRERHGRHAGARVRRGRHRRGRGARDLPRAARRCRSPAATCSNGAITRARRCASCATARSSGRARSPRCGGSRTTSRGARPASSAASGCPTSRTSSRATSSRPSRSARSPVPSPRNTNLETLPYHRNEVSKPRAAPEDVRGWYPVRC